MPPPVTLEIRELGDPILRQIAKPVGNVHDPDVQQLIDDMLKKCIEIDGVGIAAPQVGKSLRIFIVASRPNLRYPDAPLMEPTAVINPTILAFSEMEVRSWEGCLSIPGLRAKVPRPNLIEVTYTDRAGAVQTQKFGDFIARIFQHEYDHLEGKLFVDRADPLEMATEKEFQRIIKKKQSV